MQKNKKSNNNSGAAYSSLNKNSRSKILSATGRFADKSLTFAMANPENRVD